MNMMKEIHKNILALDGRVIYYGKIFNQSLSDDYLTRLTNNIEWKNDEVVIFGKQYITKRKVAFYGSKILEYKYSNSTKTALTFTPELLEIKQTVEKLTGASFNACLLNMYPTGNEGMGWHSDNESSIVKHSAIASVSFGAERKFLLKHKVLPYSSSIVLEHGSLLLMQNETQQYWLHRLPVSKRIHQPRINLTFRQMK